MRAEMKRLLELDREIALLSHIDALLGWDQETYMPPKAVEERAEQLALVEGLAHERSVSPEIGEKLEALGSTSANPSGETSLSDRERAYLRVARRAYDREVKLPADLVAELARETALSQSAWVEARSKNDFPAFAPHLERMVALKRRQAACLAEGSGRGASAYDALLDLYEPGSTEASVASVFALLRKELVAILELIRSRPQVDDSFLHRNCPAERQKAISEWIMGLMSYDLGSGRLDTVAHPFTTTLGVADVRITTRYIEDYFASSMFSTIHEAGHALYELGMAPGPEFMYSRLRDCASMAVHESQSRLWENVVGRSAPFWSANYDRLRELAGSSLAGVGAESFVKAVNKVESSLIRTEADEVTYGLHIIMRFELESDLISGRLEARDLPEAWRATSRQLLGIESPDDARGCLQDVHWAIGLFGYFPSYALGNLYAAQFWAAMRKDAPDLDGRIASGDLGPVLSWLRAKVHGPAASYLPGELALRATGSELDPSFFVSYLREKYSRVYGF